MKKQKSWLYKKTVIISGASGGLGFNIAKILIEKYDCTILGIARNKEKIEKAISTLNGKSKNFKCFLFDVSKKENWQNFKIQLENCGIFPDILINNAGFMLPFDKFENVEENALDNIINTNFISYVNSTKELLPLLKKSKTPAIINVASSSGLCPVVGQTPYTATKFAGIYGSAYSRLQKENLRWRCIPRFYKNGYNERFFFVFKVKKTDKRRYDARRKSGKKNS